MKTKAFGPIEMADDPPLEALCDFHLARKGVAVPASHVVNDDAMCSDCFKGLAVAPEELAGETGDAGLARNSREYFLRHKTAIYERRRAQRV